MMRNSAKREMKRGIRDAKKLIKANDKIQSACEKVETSTVDALGGVIDRLDRRMSEWNLSKEQRQEIRTGLLMNVGVLMEALSVGTYNAGLFAGYHAALSGADIASMERQLHPEVAKQFGM